ncbi:MAG: chloride channel protein [Proteobacteria bacterium]|nr:chloride channel protein [Pseudomonadota bacterium]
MNLLRFLLNPWREFKRSYKHISSVRWLVLGVLVGIASGLTAAAFFGAIELGKYLIQVKLAGLSLPAPKGEHLFHGEPGPARYWVIPIATTSVALLTGWLVQRFIPESEHAGTDGTDAMIKAFHQQGGVIKRRAAAIKGITSIFTIISGGSAGREGPISQMGAGIGSYLATKFKLTAKERRILLLSGAAGGLGAIFRAPLGGALTAIEVIYKEDFEAEAILPSVLSSVVAYSLFTFFYGTNPIFSIPRFHFSDPRELLFYTILALACAGTGWLYVRSFYFIKYSVFWKIKERAGLMWATGLGGLLMGILGMYYPQLLSGGYGWLEQAILGQVTIGFMLAMIIGKTMATSLTIGSGMSGGMFAPALFVGGMTGGLVGHLGHDYYPDIVTQPGGYVLVGMAAFFAGVANAPIGPLIMVTELTQGYGLLAPLMLASALCIVLGRSFSLYENQVDSKFDSPAHVVDSTINILEELKVEDFFQQRPVVSVWEGQSLKEFTDTIAETNQLLFPVQNRDNVFVGAVTLAHAREVMFESAVYELANVHDMMSEHVYLRPDYDLYSALLKFVASDYPQIPVVDMEDSSRILGLINREDVFRAYAKTIRDIHEDHL